jgi:hypothetical protein
LIESEKMYSRGAPLQANVLQGAGSVSIVKLNETPWTTGTFVAIDNLQVGDKLTIFQTVPTGASDAPALQETACVGARNELPSSVSLGLVNCSDGTAYKVRNAYGANYNSDLSDIDFSISVPGVTGVGAENGSAPYYIVDYTNFAPPFLDSFVEFVLLPASAGSGTLPLIPGDC